MAEKRKKVRGGAGTRKYCRNEATCHFYRKQNKKEKNKIRKIQKHLKRFPNDKESLRQIVRLQKVISGVQG